MPHPPRHIPRISPFILFLIRDAFMMILTVGLSAAIRLNEKWIKTENARKDAERSRTETELKYVLYDNQNDMVPLNREMDFIRRTAG